MLGRPDPPRSLTRPAGAFKPLRASEDASLGKRFDAADFSGPGCGTGRVLAADLSKVRALRGARASSHCSIGGHFL